MAAHRPLAGVTVLEVSQIMAGPTCGLMLADLGADVIKVERFPAGDDARGFGLPDAPGAASIRQAHEKGLPPPFMILNRGKRSLALDIKHPRGKETLRRLASQADVLTQNFRPGTMERLGLGYGDLRGLNPALIYCSISGYGREGPLADRGGYDMILQAFSGIMSVTGEPGRPPVKPGISIADVNAGLLATIGILGAYVHRLRTGQGQLVETSLLQAAVQQTYWFAAMYFATGCSAQPMGTANPVAAPYQTYACADGQIAIGAGNQTLWERIARALAHPEWIDDPRFATTSDRLRHREVLEQMIESAMRQRDRAHWLHVMESAGVPCGLVQSVGDALEHPQTKAVGMVVQVGNPQGGGTPALGFPIHLNETNEPAVSPAPRVGEHSVSVLSGFGFDEAEIESLVAEGVIMQDRRQPPAD